jgi:hypothetical protein
MSLHRICVAPSNLPPGSTVMTVAPGGLAAMYDVKAFCRRGACGGIMCDSSSAGLVIPGLKSVYPVGLTGPPGGHAMPALIAGFAASLVFWVRGPPRRHSGAGSGLPAHTQRLTLRGVRKLSRPGTGSPALVLTDPRVGCRPGSLPPRE